MMRTIVLPAFNEASCIADTVAQALAAGEMSNEPFEVIVVNNASTDTTAKITEELSKKDSRIRVISHPTNQLYAASCLTGAKAALGERIFILDSDGQHPPQDIWKFDRKLDEGFDFVFGWRVQRAEKLTRLIMSRFLRVMAQWYVGFDLHDVNCGIRGFTRAYAEKLEIKHRVNFANPELFIRAKLGGFRIGEVQVTQQKRRTGVPSHDFRRIWKIFSTVRGYLKSLAGELRAPSR